MRPRERAHVPCACRPPSPHITKRHTLRFVGSAASRVVDQPQRLRFGSGPNPKRVTQRACRTTAAVETRLHVARTIPCRDAHAVSLLDRRMVLGAALEARRRTHCV